MKFAIHYWYLIIDMNVTVPFVSLHTDDVKLCLSILLDIAVAWEALFVYDILIFALTLFKTYRERFYYRPGRRYNIDLVGLIVRDGELI